MNMRFILSALIALCLSFPVLAAEPAAKDITVNKDNIKQLIETLESETARTEFINNLKTLQETTQKKPEETAPAMLSDQLGVEGKTKHFLNAYRAFLERNHLNGTLVGKSALSVGAAMVFILLLLSMRKITSYARVRMNRIAQHYAVTPGKRMRHYANALKYFGYFLAVSLLVYALSTIWDYRAIIDSPKAAQVFGFTINITIVSSLGILIGEVINGAIEYAINHARNKNAARMRTLLGMIRNVILGIFFVMFALVLLSELGINILPLLAGAGIVGVAIGFGAQKFVSDFLTGFTIILEDLFHVGDVVNIAGHKGVVEDITLRKVTLRDYDGAVYTIPFSEIQVIGNLTKDYSYYQIDMGVAYREDTDEVSACMREVVEEMRAEPDYKDLILEPIEISGVDMFGASSVVIKARIKTKPIKQWDVGREFNRRIKKLFDARGIEIPYPYQTVVFGTDKQGKAGSPPVIDPRVPLNK